jgi:hypothetical protein
MTANATATATKSKVLSGVFVFVAVRFASLGTWVSSTVVLLLSMAYKTPSFWVVVELSPELSGDWSVVVDGSGGVATLDVLSSADAKETNVALSRAVARRVKMIRFLVFIFVPLLDSYYGGVLFSSTHANGLSIF